MKMGKNRAKNEKVKKKNLITINQQVVLASSSQTRQEEIRKYFDKVVLSKHKINESQEKKEKQLKAKDLAFYLARLKAISISKDYKKSIIIGCDQILECNDKIFSKPKTLIEAKENLKELSGKKHKLFTCLYVLKNLREYFVEESFAEVRFKKLTEREISDYVEKNKDTALSCVGSYKIEENEKHKFIKIIKGDIESIIGFPLKEFLKKARKEK